MRERYTTVKRLVVTAAKPAVRDDNSNATSKDVLVEVQFTGPQPSEGPGALLCDLLCGVSVDARPVELPRGRKKRARTGAASSEASDSGKKRLDSSDHAQNSSCTVHLLFEHLRLLQRFQLFRVDIHTPSLSSPWAYCGMQLLWRHVRVLGAEERAVSVQSYPAESVSF